MRSKHVSTASGRHVGTSVARFDPSTAALLGAILAVVVFVGIGLFALFRGDGADSAQALADGDGTTSNVADLAETCESVVELEVAAPPEIATVIEAAGEPMAEQCIQVNLGQRRPTEVATDIEAGKAPEVWVSDAADWTSRITEHRSD